MQLEYELNFKTTRYKKRLHQYLYGMLIKLFGEGSYEQAGCDGTMVRRCEGMAVRQFKVKCEIGSWKSI